MSPFWPDQAGPFQTWAPARQIEQIATDLGSRHPSEPDYELMAGEWVAQLLAIADALDTAPSDAAFAPAGPPPCGHRGPKGGRATTGAAGPCDRPQGHTGLHSHEAGRWRARAIDAEEQAQRVPELTRRLAAAWTEASRERDRANAAEEQVGFFKGLNARRRARAVRRTERQG